jgi:hypothetical protein
MPNRTNRSSLTPLEDAIVADLDEPFQGRFLTLAYRVIELTQADPTVYVIVRDSWRNPEQQRALYQKGRTQNANGVWVDKKDKRDPIVTRAKPGHSAHEYRRAAHIFLVDAATNKILPAADRRWKILGDQAEDVGKGMLVWGGAWKMRDMGHIEDTLWRKLAEARKHVGLGPKERYNGPLEALG